MQDIKSWLQRLNLARYAKKFVDNEIDILANDEGNGLTVTAVSDPSNGTASIGPQGASVIYTPDPNFNGTDSIEYTITDENGDTDTGTKFRQ